MIDSLTLEKIEKMPPEYLRQIETYVDYLLEKKLGFTDKDLNEEKENKQDS